VPVGDPKGALDGVPVGEPEGALDGVPLGDPDGALDGAPVGEPDGEPDGAELGESAGERPPHWIPASPVTPPGKAFALVAKVMVCSSLLSLSVQENLETASM